MADTTRQYQPTVFDYATNTQWRVSFNRIPKVDWFCTSANVPGITLGEAQYATPMIDIGITGDKLTFESLNITFIVDEELQNYRELWDWIVGIGFPKTHSQWTSVLAKGPGTTLMSSSPEANLDPNSKIKATASEAQLYSDATMIIYNSKNIAKLQVEFKDMFPTSLSALEYSQEATDVEYFKAAATFRFLYYEFTDI